MPPSPLPRSTSFVASHLIREDWIQRKLNERINDFTERHPITVFVGTWNVNAKKAGEDINAWINPLQSPAVDYDIVVVGFQEIVDLNASNLLVEHSAIKPWESIIEKALDFRYQQVSSKCMVGLALSVYVKRSLAQFITHVESERCGVGIMGVGGNKGAVAVRFMLYDSRFCFINAHLAAHQGNVAGRNSDFHAIVNKCRFNNGAEDIFASDILIWLGDLNYRISLNDLAAVYDRIDQRDWTYLLAHDQLVVQRTADAAFSEFVEAPILFAPTYKYISGTQQYDRRGEKKSRVPAWCDRIQWHKSSDIVCKVYDRAELTLSDHKPVYALFTCTAKTLVEDKRDAVRAELCLQLDTHENMSMPKININPVNVTLGSVYYNKPLIRQFSVDNVGQSMAQFHFNPKSPDSDAISESWMHVTPAFGLIPKGESVRITLAIHVTTENSHQLMTQQQRMDDILVLGLEHGRDFFITVSGEYVRTCVGTTIEYLLNCIEPIRTAMPPTLVQSFNGAAVLMIPKELWRMLDYIYVNGIDMDGLFTQPGTQSTVDYIIECLDTGAAFHKQQEAATVRKPSNTTRTTSTDDASEISNNVSSSNEYSVNNDTDNPDTDVEVDVHSMCEALIYFLSNLSQPIFPDSLVQTFAEKSSLTKFCQTALMSLTPANYNTFIYLIAFLRECLKHSAKNKLTSIQLTLIFAKLLMDSGRDEARLDDSLERVEFSVSNNTQTSSTASPSPSPPPTVPSSTAQSAVSSRVNTPTNATAVAASQAAAAPAAKVSKERPKAWALLRHYLTSPEFE